MNLITGPKFSEISLSDGDRSFQIHVWTDGEVVVPHFQNRQWRPCKSTVLRWIQLGYYGDLSEEPHFVHVALTAKPINLKY